MNKYAFILSCALLLMMEEVSAQDLVTTTKGDVISGKAMIASRDQFLQSVTVKTDDGKQFFKVFEVKSVLKKDSSLYETLKINGKYQFALLKKKGYLSLYYYVSDEVNSTGLFDKALLIKADGSHIDMPNLTFRKVMGNFLSDCPSVVNKLENKGYKKKNVPQIIDDYNACIELRETGTINTGDTAKSDKITEIIAAVNKLEQLEGRLEVIEMLNDLKKKLYNKESIPSYLLNGIRNALDSQPELVKKLEQALE